MKLIIVRHGLTIENKLGICQGQTEGRLSEKGQLMNARLSVELRDIPIDVFYASSLLRAQHTLSQILLNHKNKPYFVDSRLNEWGMGIFEGKPFPLNFNFIENLQIIEEFNAVHRRCESFLKEILKKHTNQTVLIVSHGLLIRMIESILLNIDIKKTELFENSTQKTFIL